MKVAIHDKDTYYLKRICEILQENTKDKMEVVSVGNFNNEIIKEINPDICIFPVEMKDEISNIGVSHMFITSNKDDVKKNSNAYIYKYSNVNNFIKSIEAYYNAESMYILNTNSKINAKIITFISVGGGMGSSTVSAGATTRFAGLEKRVLYINLKPFAGVGYLQITENSISIKEIVDDIENKSGRFVELANDIKKDNRGVSVLNNDNNLFGFNDVTEKQITDLIFMLDKLNRYDVIVFDIAVSPNNNIKKILEYSDHISCVLNGTPKSHEKLSYLFSYLSDFENSQLNKLRIIYNNFKMMPKVDKEISEKVIGGIGSFESTNPNDVIDRVANMKFLDKLLN